MADPICIRCTAREFDLDPAACRIALNATAHAAPECPTCQHDVPASPEGLLTTGHRLGRLLRMHGMEYAH